MIGAADERPGLDVAESQLHADPLELGELVRRVYRTIGRLASDGRRYWPMVTMFTPAVAQVLQCLR